jgi:hypothetical protein
LAKDYVPRAAGRLRALDVLYEDGHWADVVGEAGEVNRRHPALSRLAADTMGRGEGGRKSVYVSIDI